MFRSLTTAANTTACTLSLLAGLTLANPATAFAAQFAVKAWGSNASGQLGNGAIGDSTNPMETSLNNVAQLAGGQAHSLALKNDGSVWASGRNLSGQIGDGTNDQRPEPVKVLDNAIAIACGQSHSLALLADGSVWAWGANFAGQLGTGEVDNPDHNAPAKVVGLDDMVVIAIAAGYQHSMALMSDGTVRSWGDNTYGQLGAGADFDRSNVPVNVADLTNVTQIASGGFHSLALRASGRMKAWGLNFNGQLGDGSNDNRNAPVSVEGLSNISQISAGGLHSMALRRNGRVFAWGDNTAAQLGDGTVISRPLAVQVARIGNATAIDAGAYHSVAILSDGTAMAWGDNTNGQLGDGTTISRKRPVQVNGLTHVMTIEACDSYTLAVTE
jgi:hypothetical protein